MTTRAVRLLAGLGLLALGGGVLVFARLSSDPDELLRAFERGAGMPEDSVSIDDIEWLGGGRVALHGLEVRAAHPARPDVRIRRFEADLPGLRALREGEAHLGHVVLEGLSIELQQQRPAPRREAGEDALELCAHTVVVDEGRVHAARDAPLPEVEILGITGALRELCWTPASGELDAAGALAADHARFGEIRLRELVMPEVRAGGRTVAAPDGRAWLGDTEVVAELVIEGLGAPEGRPRVQVDARVRGASLADMVTAATGSRSPVRGYVTGTGRLHAGGELPRGGAWWSANLYLGDGTVFIGEQLPVHARAALKLSPWFRLDGGAIALGDTRVDARSGRGWVALDQVVVDSHGDDDEDVRVRGRDRLEAWGRIESDDARVVLSTDAGLPLVDKVGLVVEGLPPDVRVKLAGKQDLQR